MLIVPENDKLVIEARVAPHEIEQVRLARSALLRLTAFNQRTTPELNASIDRVAADVTHDTQSGTSFFIVRLSIAEEELKKLNGGILVPGMPVDVQIKTEERTALSYFIRPVVDQFARTFKER
jgi:HlyD family secretion protein